MRADSAQLETRGMRGRLTCGGPCVTGCGAQSPWTLIGSPAAPALSIAEKLEPEGWTHDVGFTAMLLGLSVLCPKCSADARKKVA